LDPELPEIFITIRPLFPAWRIFEICIIEIPGAVVTNWPANGLKLP
jgi:hypothetical protein